MDTFLSTRKDLRGVDVTSQWKLLLAKKTIQRAVKYCAQQIEKKFHGQDFVVVCILKGCVYFFVDLTRNITIPYSTYFIEASSYHNAQTQAETVELLSVLVPSKFTGKKVILLDELYDNGTTLHLVKQKLVQELKLQQDDIFTCTLFVKKKDHESEYPLPDLYGLEVPDVWVVGYGLDDCQEKRGWVNLYACPKLPNIPKTPDDEMFASAEFYQNVLKSLENQVNSLQIE